MSLSASIPLRQSLALLGAVVLLQGSLSAQAATLPHNHGASVTAGSLSAGGRYQTQASASRTGARGNNEAEASASLRDGKLRARAWSSNDPDIFCLPYLPTCRWGTSASAFFYDTITVSDPTGRLTGVEVPYSWAIDGSKTRGQWWSSATAEGAFYLGTDRAAANGPRVFSLQEEQVLSGSFLVPAAGQTLTLYLTAHLYVAADGGAVVDYSNTASFHWDLPEGLVVHSESGEFMAGAEPSPDPAPVSEPHSLALLLPALAWIGVRRRPRRPAR